MVHPVKLGRNTRMSYGKINEVLEMPNLIEIQINSYNWFLKEGLKEVFHDNFFFYLIHLRLLLFYKEIQKHAI